MKPAPTTGRVMQTLVQVAVVNPPMSQTTTVCRSCSVATIRNDMMAVSVEPTATPESSSEAPPVWPEKVARR